MVLRSRTNPYPGINIHLNNHLQSDKGDWVSYHSNHITHIREYLDQTLPENYYAVSEYGLQIGKIDTTIGWESRSRVRPDVVITSDVDSPSQASALKVEPATPTGTLTLIETLPEPDELIGLVIYHLIEGEDEAKPVARLELLSPANKIGGSIPQRVCSQTS